MKKTARWLTLPVIAAMLMSACGSGSGGSAGASEPVASQTAGASSADNGAAAPAKEGNTAAPQKLVTLTGFMMNGNNQNSIDKATWYTNILRDKLGIVLEFRDSGGVAASQVMQTMMASGDLPDIIGFSGQDGYSFAASAAKAGKLVSLDQHKDALPNIYNNPVYKNALNQSRDNLSGGLNEAYVIGNLIGPNDRDGNENVHLRWDIYRDIGMPKITTLESYLDVLDQMVKSFPQTEDGLKTYGLTQSADLDYELGIGPGTITPILYGRQIIPGLIEVDATGKDGGATSRSAFDDDAYYLRGLRLYYEANQRGLLDPDAAAQTFDEMQEKATDGRVMMTWWAWDTGYNTPEHTNASPPRGYQPVWSEDLRPPLRPDSPTGGLDTNAISSSAPLDAALKFLDFYYSYDNVILMYDGPQGELWDYGADGLRYRTKKGWDSYLNNPAGTQMDGGGLRGDAVSIFGYNPMTREGIDPALDGQTIASAYWDSVRLTNPTELVKEWRSYHDNALNIYEWARPKGILSKNTFATQLSSVVPDDIKLIESNFKSTLLSDSWKMVYAKDDAEFKALWQEIKSTADALGVPKAQEWAKENWKNCLADAVKYSSK